MRRPEGLATLGLANAVAVVTAVASASYYARVLDPAQFAVWAAALALARALLLLLDGGLKTALVRGAEEPDRETMRQLLRTSAVLAVALVVTLACGLAAFWHGGRIDAAAACLLGIYPGAYLLAHPPLFPALARMERAQRFGAIGRAEGASVVIEFSLPALLMILGLAWWAAFAVAAVFARGVRALAVVHAARTLPELAARATRDPGTGFPAPATPRALWREGLGVQAVAALSMLRDQTHLWLLGPLFGAAWAGQYTLAMTACALASQAAVVTAARAALPALRATSPAMRWLQVLAQTRRLAIATLPVVALLPAWLLQADQAWWQDRWRDALPLVPWLAVRMAAGVATTTLGAWMLVAASPWRAAQAHAKWTAIEVVLAALLLLMVGPVGMAMAGAFSGWAGVWLFLATADPAVPALQRLFAVARAVLWRASVIVAVLLAAWCWAEPQSWLLATALLPLAWLAEPSVRRRLAAWCGPVAA